MHRLCTRYAALMFLLYPSNSIWKQCEPFTSYFVIEPTDEYENGNAYSEDEYQKNATFSPTISLPNESSLSGQLVSASDSHYFYSNFVKMEEKNKIVDPEPHIAMEHEEEHFEDKATELPHSIDDEDQEEISNDGGPNFFDLHQ